MAGQLLLSELTSGEYAPWLAAVNLAEAALAIPSGPRHIVTMSSLAAVGPCPEGRCADEDDPLRPLTPYARNKAALESVLRG